MCNPGRWILAVATPHRTWRCHRSLRPVGGASSGQNPELLLMVHYKCTTRSALRRVSVKSRLAAQRTHAVSSALSGPITKRTSCFVTAAKSKLLLSLIRQSLELEMIHEKKHFSHGLMWPSRRSTQKHPQEYAKAVVQCLSVRCGHMAAGRVRHRLPEDSVWVFADTAALTASPRPACR